MNQSRDEQGGGAGNGPGLDAVAKALALFALGAYLTGVLTVSVYLRREETPTPDLMLFKAHYIYTGVEVLFLIGIASFAIYLGCHVLEQKARVGALVAGTLVCVLALLLYAYLLQQTLLPWHMTSHTLRVTMFFLLLGIVTPLPMIWLHGLGNAAINSRTDGRLAGLVPEHTALGLAALFALAGIVGFTVLYAFQVYPHLAEQYGGGAPRQARILFSPAGAQEASQLGVPIQPGSQVSRPVSLLLEGDAYYALLIPKTHRVVQVSKSDVDGLLIDTVAPKPLSIKTTNKGRAGRPDPNDQLVFTFSEPIYPASLLDGWTGHKIDAFVRVTPSDKPGVGDALTIFHEDEQHPFALGRVGLGNAGYANAFGNASLAAAVIKDQSEIIVTLKNTSRKARAGGQIKLHWRPSASATDIAGNPLLVRPVISQPAKRQF